MSPEPAVGQGRQRRHYLSESWVTISITLLQAAEKFRAKLVIFSIALLHLIAEKFAERPLSRKIS
jgi:hypothetical protein